MPGGRSPLPSISPALQRPLGSPSALAAPLPRPSGASVVSPGWSWMTVPRPKTSEERLTAMTISAPKRAAHRDRDRVDDRAVDQPAAVEKDRLEEAGDRVGGADGADQAAAADPDFVAGAEFGRRRTTNAGSRSSMRLSREFGFEELASACCRRTVRRRRNSTSSSPKTLRRVRRRAKVSRSSSRPAQ